jgi:hydrogenase maturation protein HypF
MERRAIAVRGIVQGVGFRPFVYRLATEAKLAGFVRNQLGDVLIEVEGVPEALDRFLGDLVKRRPPLAGIEEVTWQCCVPCGDREFHIEPSAAGRGDVLIGPDVATCDACLRELFDPGDRRYRYPFLNCTDCGPRLTIVRGVPYDRERTTLAGFALCPACRAEYEDPADRRFHAQPTACPACGPSLALLDAAGQRIDAVPLRAAALALVQGRIVAVKGLGGYHLACDARAEQTVQELRRRKHRNEKPFAVMVADLDAARALCRVSDAEAQLLCSPRRPIVLLRRGEPPGVAPSVAPGNPCLGLMLPYTPLHHLLLHDVGRRALVMTSGNRSDEPIAFEDADAVARLGGVADLFLTHDRPIHLRCDDSVTRIVAGAELPLRRSRGYAPQPVRLPIPASSPILAVGGQLKNTFALGRGRHALLGHHQGDLDHYEAFRAFVAAIAHYERLFDVHPEWVAHDLHPDYASTRYALDRPDVRRLAVQHHHAHLAACLAEHTVEGDAIGVTFDGTGLGSDGAVWGGEFLVGGYGSFRRAAQLRYVRMPGGEQAIREPWRMALAHLLDAGEDTGLVHQYADATTVRAVGRLVERPFNAPLTSSAGRLFDAAAALAGLRGRVSYEGQAAVELEGVAWGQAPAGTYPFDLEGAEGPDRPLVVDTRPLIAALARDTRAGEACGVMARRFHSTLVEVVVQVCGLIREQTGLTAVALSGGVFLNALLSEETGERLRALGFRVVVHQQVPPGDGGLCLGQLAVAAAQIGSRE